MNVQTPIAPSAPDETAIRPSRRSVLQFVREQPLGTIGFLIIVIMFVSAVFAPFIAPHPPEHVDFEASPALGGGAPSANHLLGADAFGRDILSRLIYGARTALSIGFISAFIGCSLGAIIGTVSAFAGGKVDLLMQRFIDILLSFPIIILAIVVIAIMLTIVLLFFSIVLVE